ncbi:sugar phosphate isomerase/epimerase family protein [Candidatus Laterigemmans baculatus]|uniref:sugar phosphate isomerase/epimerase family protein n=1 Tax=Candidatus Laterigemmans baculatus TaxID=2770505 RepID=UPI0013DB545C|nr:TIM barrel protein [Candidatus Laterigemmans baculatus]
MRIDRRTVLAAAAASCAAWMRPALGGSPKPEAAAAQHDPSTDTKPQPLGPLCLFAKHLQWLSPADLADLLAEMDVEGIEATIRSGGQVEPADVVEGLPRLAEALARRDRRIVIMTTEITSVETPHAEAVLKTGVEHGATHYRMGYYRYDLDRPILPQLDAFTHQAEHLAELNQSLGIHGLYQNHAGDRYFGAPLWDLHQMLTEVSTKHLAAAYDVRHATVEAGMSWPLDWALIRPHVGAIYLKDFQWLDGKPQNVPFGTGQVSHRLFKTLSTSGLGNIPVSLHMEYIDHRRPELIDQCVAAYREDRKTIRRLIGI